MKHCANILEILLIFALFFLYGAYAVPDSNEAHYIEKAAHFWNPNYVVGDAFLDSPDAHGVFYWTFGWLTLYLSMDQVVWTGRILTWLGLAAGWFWMTAPLFARWGLKLLTASLFLFFLGNFSFAGEWVVGGVEAKGFSYVFAFFGLGEIIRHHWNRGLILLGLAAMFHVLVGGWCLLALGIAWLILKDYERGLKKSGTPEDLEKCFLPTFKSILPGLAAAFFLTLPALIPALQLNSGVSPEIAKQATQLYVYERLPHHLLLSFIVQKTPENLLMFGILILIWNYLCARPRQSHGEMTFRTFVYASLLIGMTGWGINLFMNAAPELTASLLRYYWFRLVDVMLPAGAAILCVEYVFRPTDKTENRASHRRRVLLFGFLLFLACLPVYDSAKRLSKPMKPRSCSGASRGQTWLDLCQYVRENTEKTDVFVVPYTTRTFRWFARRSTIGIWKDVPQDAQGLMDWWERMQDQFYGFDPSKPVQAYGRVASFTLMPKQKFEYLKERYGAKYIIRNKNDLKGRAVVQDTPNGIADYELVYENKDFELRKLTSDTTKTAEPRTPPETH